MKSILLLSSLAFSALAVAFFIPKSQFRTPIHQSPINQSPIHQSPINQSPIHQSPLNQPIELGQVHWLRDLDTGRAESLKSGKPILLLFQEVPGCSNCTRYGNTTLSHPLIVEAIETYFVPVCIFNNKGGKDAEALRIFGEPAWNNPVVRIVRADNQDIVLRMPNFNSSLQLVNGMRRALDLTGTTAPRYLELLEEELSAREVGLETATFSMHCFWTGEGTFGAIPGVIETEPGFQDGKGSGKSSIQSCCDKSCQFGKTNPTQKHKFLLQKRRFSLRPRAKILPCTNRLPLYSYDFFTGLPGKQPRGETPIAR